MAERKSAKVDEKKRKFIRQMANEKSGIVAVLAGYSYNLCADRTLSFLPGRCSKPLTEMSRQEFLSRELTEAFALLAGKEMAEKLPELIDLRLEGQFSSSPCRRSYRSSQFWPYAHDVIELMRHMVYQSCYVDSVQERLYCKEDWNGGFDYLLALEIRRNNTEIIGLLHDALMGDNSDILLTRDIIHAIIISGHEGLVDDLLKLLLAARLQEGLRQQILEAADIGSTDILQRILKVCLDEKLFRFSSVIRAFDTWSGMGFGDQKPAQVQKYAQIAYDSLTNEPLRQEYLRSDNNIETYFALWAQGCHEFMTLYEEIPTLLDDPRHYRKVLGWMFVSQTDNSHYQAQMASQHLHERDLELLAWIVPNLPQQRFRFYGYEERLPKPKPRPHLDLSDNPAERKALFAQLKELAAYIGNKKRTFTGNPFEFSVVTLTNEPVYDCIQTIAAHDMNPELVQEVLTLAPNMTTDQRQSVLLLFLQPDHNASHRAFLQNSLNDRSITVKLQAVKLLKQCKLTEPDLNALADSLRSKSSDLRAAVMEIFKVQPVEMLSPLLSQMLTSGEENQLQAAIELLTEQKDAHPELLDANRAALDALRTGKLSTQTQILMDRLCPPVTDADTYTAENGYGLYDPAVVSEFIGQLRVAPPKNGFFARFFSGKQETLLSAKEIRTFLPTKADFSALIDRLNQVFERHAGDEVEIECYGGSREKKLFGDVHHNMPLRAGCGYDHMRRTGARLEMIPFWPEFREALGDYATDPRKALGLMHMVTRIYGPYAPAGISYRPWFLQLASLGLAPELKEQSFNRKHLGALIDIMEYLTQLFDAHVLFTEI
ncbi:MAG: hypothetical protein IJY28_08585, partial [Clostridia bacterium]|nr:hypothetical protein [Clostridia bacterium]